MWLTQGNGCVCVAVSPLPFGSGYRKQPDFSFACSSDAYGVEKPLPERLAGHRHTGPAAFGPSDVGVDAGEGTVEAFLRDAAQGMPFGEYAAGQLVGSSRIRICRWICAGWRRKSLSGAPRGP